MEIDPNECPGCLGYKPAIVSICGDCLKRYGGSAVDWPGWLRFLVNDNARINRQDEELRYEISLEEMVELQELGAWIDKVCPQIEDGDYNNVY